MLPLFSPLSPSTTCLLLPHELTAKSPITKADRPAEKHSIARDACKSPGMCISHDKVTNCPDTYETSRALRQGKTLMCLLVGHTVQCARRHLHKALLTTQKPGCKRSRHLNRWNVHECPVPAPPLSQSEALLPQMPYIIDEKETDGYGPSHARWQLWDSCQSKHPLVQAANLNIICLSKQTNCVALLFDNADRISKAQILPIPDHGSN